MDVLTFLCYLGSCGTVGDIEFTANYIQVFRIGKHHPPFLQASMRENGVVQHWVHFQQSHLSQV